MRSAPRAGGIGRAGGTLATAGKGRMGGIGRGALPRVAAGVRRLWLAALVANGLARALLALVLALAARQALVASPPVGPGWLLAAMAAAVLAIALLRWRETVDAEQIAQHYVAQVRLRLFDRLARMTPTELSRRSRGGVLLRFIGDVHLLRAWVGLGIARLIVASFGVVAILGALAWLAPLLAFGVAALVGMAAVALAANFGALRTSTLDSRRRQTQVAANMHDKIASIPLVQLAGQVPRERRTLRRQSRRLRASLVERAGVRGRQQALVVLASGGVGVLVLAQLLGVPLLHLAPMDLATAVATITLTGLLAAPLRDLARAAEAWVGAGVARERLAEFLGRQPAARVPVGVVAAEPSVRSCDAPPPADTQVNFQAKSQVGPQADRADPHVAQADSDPPKGQGHLRLNGAVVRGRVGPVHAHVRPNSRVALLGPPGSGKSSLLWLMAGLLRADHGEVLCDGQPPDSLSAVEWRRRVSLLAPELGLQRGSLRRNLHYQRPAASDEDILLACARAGLELSHWPRGLRTRVQDAGQNFGHGERRALQLARALVGNPAVLLIDDVEACLPSPVAGLLVGLLAQQAGSVVFATTDPTLALLADEVWRLQDGRIVPSDATSLLATEPKRGPPTGPLH